MGPSDAVTPSGFSDIPPPPDGFSPVPPPPAGFSDVNPVNPPLASGDPQVPNTAVPGFWSTIGSAFGRGLTQRIADDISGGKAILPPGFGGQTLEQQFQAQTTPPPTQDEIDSLLAKRVNEGWSDPKWWGAQIAHGTGSTVPGMVSAGVGAAIGGGIAPVAGAIPGGAVGFGAEGAVGAIVPAYKKARAEGLSPDDAMQRAIVDSGISAATATAMGLAPGVSFFGKSAAPELVNGQIASMLRRPTMEMLAQLGIVQPSLAVTGELATALTHGETPNPWDLATTGVVGIGMGGAMVGAHATIRSMNSSARTQTAPVAPAEPSVVDAAHLAQEPPPPQGFTASPSGETPPVGGEPSDSAEPPVAPPLPTATAPEAISTPPPAASSNPFTSIKED